ncbi:hypothetical protein TIFTF001_028815 [Ficus carica]|uniref:Uncharacterized protein n=1 Tax=Ficus carica TaxID=3494 RepID=A0AA88DQM1_FICCA|nr:hypothetical protein TIFTF001_028815 [Ficus carica]
MAAPPPAALSATLLPELVKRRSSIEDKLGPETHPRKVDILPTVATGRRRPSCGRRRHRRGSHRSG